MSAASNFWAVMAVSYLSIEWSMRNVQATLLCLVARLRCCFRLTRCYCISCSIAKEQPAPYSCVIISIRLVNKTNAITHKMASKEHTAHTTYTVRRQPKSNRNLLFRIVYCRIAFSWRISHDVGCIRGSLFPVHGPCSKVYAVLLSISCIHG